MPDQEGEGQKKKVLVFRVTLTDSEGRVRGYPYRTIAVPEDFTLVVGCKPTVRP
jgi:hypothetical protein